MSNFYQEMHESISESTGWRPVLPQTETQVPFIQWKLEAIFDGFFAFG
jgi:hypothetical protein